MSATATLPAPDLSHISDSTRTCPTANLTGAILVAANLSHAYLENAYLGDADLSNAILANAVACPRRPEPLFTTSTPTSPAPASTP